MSSGTPVRCNKKGWVRTWQTHRESPVPTMEGLCTRTETHGAGAGTVNDGAAARMTKSMISTELQI